MKTLMTAAAATLVAGAALADGHCAAGKTLTDGTLTIATGNPAYYPCLCRCACWGGFEGCRRSLGCTG